MCYNSGDLCTEENAIRVCSAMSQQTHKKFPPTNAQHITPLINRSGPATGVAKGSEFRALCSEKNRAGQK